MIFGLGKQTVNENFGEAFASPVLRYEWRVNFET